jgi:ketosteroid isomerase-like protein
MSEENVEIVKRIHAAWEKGDFSSVDWADPAIEYTVPGPDPKTYTGVEEMGRQWAEWLRAWKDYRVVAREFIDAGDEVVVIQSFRGEGRGSGVPIDHIPGAAVMAVGTDGKVIRFTGYTDPEDALDAAGVSH